MNYQVGDLLRYEQHRNYHHRFEAPKIMYCIVVETYEKHGGNVYWFHGTNKEFIQHVDWNHSFYGTYYKVT